jgi:hypothetical protein
MRLFGLRTCLCAVGAFLVLAAPVFAATPPLSHTVHTSAADVETDEIGGYVTVRLAGASSTVEEGSPELPVEYVRFVLPEGTVAVGAEAFVRSSTELDGLYDVRPTQPQVPLSRPELARWVDPDAAVYSSETPYPATPCVLLGTGNISGRPIATVAVHPVQYVPAARKLIVNETIEITLALEVAPGRARVPSSRSESAQRALDRRLSSLVVNDEDVPTAALRGPRTAEAEYLIITYPSYVSSFQVLADWKEQKGLTTEIVTTDWIYANYSGVDNQEKVRNCIIDYYENYGTTWVLLGGDTNRVPARTVFAINTDAGNDEIRCDLYYADLDGTWNADGDGKWGEVNQDEVDMYADVFVGRAPVDTSTEATRFVTKVLTYEGAPGGSTLHSDYQLDMLFLAEVLWSEPWTDGGICKDMIDDDSVPAQFDPITKLYQTNGQLTRSQTMGNLNAGQNIVNHVGHAYYNVMSIGSSALYTSDMNALSNAPRYGIWYSIGCWPAAIDYNCIAEGWMNSPGGGGVAFVGNSRFGWGSPGNPGYGTSDRFDREFFHQLFNEGLHRIGMANAAHKDAYVVEAHNSGYTRYCLYELNLLGDPEMRVWTDEPLPAVANHPDTVPLGEHTFLVIVSREGEPVPEATVFLTGGDVNVLATTDEFGIATLLPDPAVEGDLTLTVTGQGVLPYTTTVVAVNDPPVLTPPAAVDELTLADPFDLGGIVALDWTPYDPPADFAFYSVYRSTEAFTDVSGMTPIESGLLMADVKEWDDTTAEPGQSYHYAVTATDLTGGEDSAVDSEGPIAGTVNSRILLWDADDGDTPFDGIGDDYTPNDGTERAWVEALDSIGELYTIKETLPADLSPFELVIYLGGVVNFGDPEANARMTDDEATALTAYVDGGGSLYVEEPNFGSAYSAGGTPATIELWNRFHASFEVGCNFSTGNVASVAGQSGTTSDGMSFVYDHQNLPDQFVGIVAPDGEPGSSLLWKDQDLNDRGCVYVDPVSGGRLYMVPILLGGVSDAGHPSTRLEYVTRLLDETELIGTSGVEGDYAGRANWLGQNAPNPFNPATSIRFSVAHQGAHVTLAIYDVTGRLVRELVNEPTPAGEHLARWDGRSSSGRPVSSGIYFYRLSVDGWTDSRKMVLLK